VSSSARPAPSPGTDGLRWPTAAELGRSLPGETDVLVVGGGLAGTALSYYLARAGVEVVLVDRSELNREASGTNTGSFHYQIAIHQLTAAETAGARRRLLAEVRLNAEAAEVWKGLEAELGGEIGVHTTGGLMVAETAAELQLLEDKQLIEAEAGVETHVLAGRELRDFAPYLADDLAGASYCPQEGHANPLLAAPLFARRALELGATIRTGAEVSAVEAGGRGARRFTVTTSAGEISAHRFVNAAGAWANDVAGLCGLRLPLRAEGLHVNVSEPYPRLLGPLVQHIGRRLTLKQSADQTFIIGGGWPSRRERPPRRYSALWESAAGNTAVAVRVLPGLAGVRIVRMWTGALAFTDDLSPVIGESTRLPGYHTFVATTGFTLGPMMARLLADAMSAPGGRGLVPAEYSPDRAPACASSPT